VAAVFFRSRKSEKQRKKRGWLNNTERFRALTPVSTRDVKRWLVACSASSDFRIQPANQRDGGMVAPMSQRRAFSDTFDRASSAA
jgi:hypothetical protein